MTLLYLVSLLCYSMDFKLYIAAEVLQLSQLVVQEVKNIGKIFGKLGEKGRPDHCSNKDRDGGVYFDMCFCKSINFALLIQ